MTLRQRVALCLRFLLPLLLPSLTHAALPRAASVPGGVAVVSLGPVATGARPPRAWLGEQPVLVAADAGQWVGVVGLALDTPPGTYALRVEEKDQATEQGKSRRVHFQVSAKDYPEQRITLKDSSKVQLSASDLARVEGEIAAIQGIKRHWRDADDTDTDFILPAAGRLTGRFGVRRFFNGEARSPHAGFDIASPRGGAVKANAHGIVLATGDYFFNGQTVFVDHGNGLISMYCHLERIDVQTGETVGKGQRLGRSGMSGRATGPHLHWSVILNGAMVDPQLFVASPGRMR
ncbi:MAG: Glycyl-glycine endopeptidase ALE-1 precursor [Candidatus Accumulibacter phosphatis]|uniref:Glycyl-glycine endopeptidase ALE-1 n=1 Tax=Candidatus Accumulibacter phosphatis TaxID=327160 RepID=A0A080LZI1_9PROT|nr:peptidoglycan DD-metalloendopeptidase family protein [Accumulibacter sp.]KFB74313.1 MAG: Glycyl-glycine endopeptidase ALE-1 precursor [Candidatus Accumulibacter phosphatis]MBL8409608.1 peptidoglycan DD-metalloendopeptidase family protein [Accumulibacter sp.]HRF10604.1 peptidoglycan DD-metalloendopeptidase family protein [Candidatus Accumulibacter phosphatis]